jgi:hypothetical protein
MGISFSCNGCIPLTYGFLKPETAHPVINFDRLHLSARERMCPSSAWNAVTLAKKAGLFVVPGLPAVSKSPLLLSADFRQPF